MSVVHHLISGWDPDNLAFPDQTYQEFQVELLQYVSWLRKKGLKKGDRICLQMEKSHELLSLILASMLLGCPVLPLNEKYTATEVLFYLQDIEPTLSILRVSPKEWPGEILSPSVCAEIQNHQPSVLPRPSDPDELALFLYTSGTTGKPKGAMISHGNILACLSGLHRAWHWKSSDILLHLLPLFHVHGLVVAQLGALYAGAKTVSLSRFDAEKAAGLLVAEHITVCMAVPTIHYRFLQLEQVPKLPRLRLMTSGSAPLPVSVHEQIRQKFGVTIIERYGMTEVGIVLSNPYPEDGEPRAGTVGFPVGQTQFRIVNSEGEEVPIGSIGELLIKGPSVIQGYWRREEQTKQTIVDGWLASGDLARLDEQGYYSIVGRAKDLIISGGFNVYPKEIEALLLEIDLVQEAAVIGLPDEEWGEKVVAVLIGSGEHEAILEYCKAHLAPYKCPKEVVFLDEFPRNAMGKIQKSRLRTSLGGGR